MRAGLPFILLLGMATWKLSLHLAHPAIHVNVQTRSGFTPFFLACCDDRVSVVQLLLKDPRVDVTLADEDEWTQLWWASWKGRYGMIEWLIASGRDLGDVNQKGIWSDKEYTALEIAREMNKTEVVSLLERFMANPVLTRYQVRVKLGLLDELAAEVFALSVFLCDDLLQLKTDSPSTAALSNPAATVRFFAIASKLPMELQMILCRRAVGSMKQNILLEHSSPAFKFLAQLLIISK